MKCFYNYLKQHKVALTAFLIFFVLLAVSFTLYKLPIKAVIYPVLLMILIGGVMLWHDYRKAIKKHNDLQILSKLSAELITAFPEPSSIEDEDYRLIIENLVSQQRELTTKMNGRYNDMLDYYTLWVHQIKTPIASMRLNLQNEDSELSRQIMADLFRIEQYVEMVLAFLRLNSESTDYVFDNYSIDKIIKQTVRKFSSEFIRRKISLNYEPTAVVAITDEKWLAFVLEQLISNALKYTNEGSITIEVTADLLLKIKDTGIGIEKSDLPRVFEKGYTGYNGRHDKKASGIGLYLCKRICDNLGHSIRIESEPEKGTAVTIDLARKNIKHE